jgi:hypothetical protein
MTIRTALVLAVLAATPALAQAAQPLPTFSEEEARASGPGHPWQGGPWWAPSTSR